MSFSAELTTAIEAAKAGGEVARKYFRLGTTVRSKEAYNLVSDADLEAEEVVVATIKSRFPDHAFYGEETYKDSLSAEKLWIIDPLDGTNNFAHAIPHFACSVAYVDQGVVQAGAVHNPMSGETYYAERGKKAWYESEPAEVSKETELNQVIIGCGFYYDRGKMMQSTLAAIGDLFQTHIHGIRRMGAASLDLCYVATGRFGAYFEYQLEPWDFAAGALIVEEAGGQTSDAKGAPLPLQTSSIIASNGALHSAVSEIATRHCPWAQIREEDSNPS